jgi:hypothetical protein
VKTRVLIPMALLAAAMFCVFLYVNREKTGPGPNTTPLLIDSAEVNKRMNASCSRCHKFPKPNLLPKSLWPDTITKMYGYIGMKGKRLDGFLAEDVSAWYQSRAPDSIPFQRSNAQDSALKFKEHRLVPPGPPPPSPAVSHIRLYDRNDGRGQNILLSDMRHKFILKADISGGLGKARFSQVARLPHPCHMDLIDLDGDGLRDILVANLGSFNPGDHQKGSVSLVRKFGQRSRRVQTLAKGLGRVSDARAADFDGDGDLDVLVGVFGWHATGELLWLENRTKDWNDPDFYRHPIDSRHGVIHTPIIDLNKDGKPDFLAQLSQEYESVVAFTNTGGQFQASIIDAAPHPAWGSNGMQLFDLDGDGDQDALLCNGDSLDDMVLRPSHGLRWLENKGSQWVPHDISAMYAVHGAKAADLDGDGDLDLVASAFLPQYNPKDELAGSALPSLMWFEQTSTGQFKPWIIERLNAFHPTLDLGDIDADGDIDIVVGNFTMKNGNWDQIPYWLQVWENPGKKK